jgi:hypothetical protein
MSILFRSLYSLLKLHTIVCVVITFSVRAAVFYSFPVVSDLSPRILTGNQSAVMNRYELLSNIIIGLLLAFLIQTILVPIFQRVSTALPWANYLPMSTNNVGAPARPPQFVDSAPFSIPNIASLLTEYYNLLIRICYYEPSDIAFPPHPTIDNELCSRLNLSAEVIELMQSIPFPATYDTSLNKLLYQSSRAYVFTDPEDLVASRDPWVDSREIPEAEVNLATLQPWEVPIATAIHMDIDFRGYITLLDTRNGTIRLWGDSIGMKPEEECRQETNHYLNWPTRAAEAVLEEMVENVKTLRWIPIVHSWRGRFVRKERWTDYEDTKKVLLERGWGGDSWDREEWARVKDEVYQDVCERRYELDEQEQRAEREEGS